MHKLLTSCLWGAKEVKSNKASPSSKYAPHDIGSHPHATPPAPPPASTQPCTRCKQPPPDQWTEVPQCSLAPVLPETFSGRQCPEKSKADWDLTFLGAAPFSVAIVASDAKEVLYAKHGLEPTAAQLLDQALQFNSTSRPSDVPLAQQKRTIPESEHGGKTGSFLTALLGPETEAVAIHTARQDRRWWKGTISVQLPEQPATSPLNDPSSTGASHKDRPISPSEYASTEPFLQEGTTTASAVAARRMGSAPGVLGSPFPLGSRRSSSVMMPGCKPAIKAPSSSGASSLKQDDSSKRVQWVCPEADTAGAVSVSIPFKQVSEDVNARPAPTTASPEPPRSRSSCCSSLCSQGNLHNPSLPVPPLGPRLASLPRVQRATPLGIQRAKSCPSSRPCMLGQGRKPGEEEEGKQGADQEEGAAEEFKSQASFSRASCRSSRMGGNGNQSLLHPRPSSTGRSSHRRPLFSPEVAIEQLEQSGSGPEEYATRTVALLKSISHQRASEDASCQLLGESASAPPTQLHQGTVSAGPLAMPSHISAPAPAEPSNKSRSSTISEPAFTASDKPAATSVVMPAVTPTATSTLKPDSTASICCPSNSAHGLTSAHGLSSTHGSVQAVEPQLLPPWSSFSNAASSAADGKLQNAGTVENSDPSAKGAHAQCQPTSTDPTKLDAYVRMPALARFSRKSSGMVQNLEDPVEESSQTEDDPLPMAIFLRDSSSRFDARQASLTHALEADEEHHQPHREASSLTAPQSAGPTQGRDERTSEPTCVDEGKSPSQSFDVLVSTLSEDAGSPLLVFIFSCTEHMQLKATLVALAETQLELLSSCMPQHAIQFLAMESTDAVPEHVGQLARAHQDTTILFMDVVGFTSMSKNVKPVEVMVFLNKLFSLFDRLTDEHGVHKVETAGDCYIVAGGVMSPDPSSNGFRCVAEDHDPAESAKQVMCFAKALLEAAKQVNMPDTNEPVRVRVGLHTGAVVSGMIGSKMPKFSIFGDTMNTASRIESTGVPGRIHVSETTQMLLPQEQWESTGGVHVKGKGEMQTYLWVPSVRHEQQQAQPSLAGTSDPLPCVSLKQAPTCVFIKQARTLFKHLGTPATTLTAPTQRSRVEVAAHALGCKERNSDPPCLSLAAEE